eukprot:6791142-Alexandrium_andersonii.AAC.1
MGASFGWAWRLAAPQIFKEAQPISAAVDPLVDVGDDGFAYRTTLPWLSWQVGSQCRSTARAPPAL